LATIAPSLLWNEDSEVYTSENTSTDMESVRELISATLQRDIDTQSSRTFLVRQLFALILEEQDLKSAELEFYRQMLNGTEENANVHRSNRLEILKAQQEQLMLELRVLDARIDDLHLEERHLRYTLEACGAAVP
jgi:hypothetical protein